MKSDTRIPPNELLQQLEAEYPPEDRPAIIQGIIDGLLNPGGGAIDDGAAPLTELLEYQSVLTVQ